MRNELSQDELALVQSKEFRHRLEIAPSVFTRGKTDVKKRIDSYGIDLSHISGRRILDIGCWSGGFTFYFEFLGAEAVGVDVMDPSKSGFNELHSLVHSKASFYRKSVYDLEVSEVGLFDFVFFQGVFYHLKHPILALEKINSLLKLGGILFGSGQTSDSYFQSKDKIIKLEDELPKANEFPIAFFVRDDFLGDKTNWFIPNECCVEAWLKRMGFKCTKITTKIGVKSASGVSRSEAWFIAEKVSEPEPEHPFL